MDDPEIEQKAWDIVRTWLEGATPEQWHRFAARSNYDGNDCELRWLLDNRQVDRATALLIYWNLGAAWYVQYANESDLGDGSIHLDTFRLLREIERRYADGHYADHGIRFDPHDFEGAGPDDYPDVPVVRPVPALMLQPTSGSVYVDLDEAEGYDEGLPFDVAERLYALYD
ncbi:hypothetical protein GQ57_09445 [Burkholderia sp. MSh2]|uniref:DUF4274 domain-containing protein n=1 Tax=Burkholderia paludis TaxID=1506587 RepID=A0A6J5E889_9BURK|nr:MULTISPECIES: DUF4274 domain-containing protein [Burkholderia]KEZ05953.1 hypothetical protein GQ57_09445 [Burkholderia sp. MSh2]KFG96732.1 hypothetical protein GQ56_0113125 [Burkholderia paludis]CAB3761814.1 hypothetical protein LMG30113_04033 [Burkholderia paludis]VWB39420.1 hypothetical protein BPA30113_01618 [Burkholderia paludis]